MRTINDELRAELSDWESVKPLIRLLVTLNEVQGIEMHELTVKDRLAQIPEAQFTKLRELLT